MDELNLPPTLHKKKKFGFILFMYFFFFAMLLWFTPHVIWEVTFAASIEVPRLAEIPHGLAVTKGLSLGQTRTCRSQSRVDKMRENKTKKTT